MSVTSTTKVSDRAARQRAVAEAEHSAAMEGLTVGDTYREDAAAYVDGRIDVDELVRRTRARHGLD